MATEGPMPGRGGGSRWTLLLWGGAALLLALPFFAMRFTSEVDWSASDFIIMGIMLGIVCACVELAVRLTDNVAYRLAAGAAIAGAFLITWVNLAVGIVGSEDNPSNALFFYALLLGIAGAALARFRNRGMSVAMLATAAAVAAAFVIAVSGATDEPNVSHWRELFGTGVITSPFLLSALLFRRAARR
jgi:hypothetical protein